LKVQPLVFVHFVKWCLGLAPAETQTTAGEAEHLARHARGARRLAEIGVWHGRTTKLLRSAMASDGVLYAVDPFFKGRLGFSIQRAIARREVAAVGNGTVVWVPQTAVDAASNPLVRSGGPFDFVFIDALHTYEGLRDEWEAWSPLVAPGGTIAIHDSRATAQTHTADVGSVRYTTEIVLSDRRFDVVDVVDSLTVLRRVRQV
jgi:predicted O-methyltransferase YrrM